jgi:predicted transcriptional regulator
LSWEERFVFTKAVNELIKKGIDENINGAEPNLKLTPKGVDLLFCCT